MKRLLFLLMFVLVIVNGSALTFYSSECFRDGSIKVVVNAFDHEDDKIFTDKIETNIGGIKITNDWSRDYLQRSNDASRQYGVIETDEAMYNEAKTYKIYIRYEKEDGDIEEMDASVDCLGLKFSCKLLDMKIDDCYTKDNYFYSFLTIKGLRQSVFSDLTVEEGLDFTLEAEKRYIDYNGVTKKTGELPSGYTIDKIGEDKYRIKASFFDNKVNKLYARFDLKEFYKVCDYTEYPEQTFFDEMECYEKTGESGEEAVAEEDNLEEEEPVESVVEEKPVEEVVEEEQEEINVETELNKRNFIIFALIIVVVVLFGYIQFFIFKKKGHI